jgi:L-lysine 2,3-aminomutase
MNTNSKEATTLHGESRLEGRSSDEEPGAKTTIFSHNEIPTQLVSNRSSEFMHRYFPLTTINSWNDWKWQLRNAITSIDDLKKIMRLSEKEIMAINNLEGRLPLRITPFFASLIYKSKYSDPMRRNVIPAFERAFNYISSHTEVRDVLISGGDPLTLTDEALDYILSRIRSIGHVEIIRIGTRVPVVLPQRITDKLISTLRKYHPLFLSLHFSHPDEITGECARACNKLADGGFPLGSQTVLLKGINDNIPVMKELFHKLLKIRVRPYYLYQCDLIPGSGHFRTTVKKGLEIMKGLRGFTSGYAVPTFVVDAPGGGGKIPLLPDYVVDHNEERIVLRNYKGLVCEYPEK